MSTTPAGGAPHLERRRADATSGRTQGLIPPPTTWRSRPRRNWRHRVGGRRHVDGLEVGRADDLEILHVRRVVVEIVHDARTLMHDVAGLNQGRLVLVHEAG